MIRPLTVTLASLLAAVWLAPAEARPRFKKLSKAEIETTVKPMLRAGETIDHAVFSGPLGPDARATLVLAQRAHKVAISRLVGFVIAGKRRIPLPLPDTHWSSGVEVAAVLLVNLDKDRHLEIVVMTTYMTGAGPQGTHDRYENYVLDYNGKHFVRLARLEKKVRTLGTARRVKKALGLLGRKTKKK